MNKFLRFGLMAMALVFVFNAIAVTETKAQLINDILKRMDAHNKALKSLESSVKMDKYNPQLDEHDINEGAAKYVTVKNKNPLVRIDWKKPVEESISVVNGQYLLVQPRLKQAITGKVNDNKGTKGANSALAFMNMSKMQLKNNYEVSYIGKETVSGGAETWHLQLVPKTKQSYKTAELWVDGNGMPVQAKVIEVNNDSTTVFLSNLQKNISINTKEFVIAVPKDYKLIKS